MKKLRTKAGETLMETLCAVLVTGLAVALLAGMFSASSRLSKKAAQAAAELYDTVSGAERAADTAEDGHVTVEIDGTEVTLPVKFYGEADQAVSYRREAAP